MNPKKRHEVAFMAKAVGAICRERSCDLVVDVGAGLVGSIFNPFMPIVIFVNMISIRALLHFKKQHYIQYLENIQSCIIS